MPGERAKRKAPELPVPAKGEDPAERKRVLNVLAQRRYRQRRREHVKKLEKHAGSSSSKRSPEALEESGSESSATPVSQPPDVSLAPAFTEVPKDTVQLSDVQQPAFDQGQLEFDPFAEFDPNFVTPVQGDWDSMLPSLPGTPFSTDISSSDPDCTELSLTPFSPPGTTPSNTPSTFPDEQNLLMQQQILMRGAIAIATRLNIGHLVWSLDATSPFTDPAIVQAGFDHLPLNLRPTRTQMTLPHHPVIDLLPWPKVRDRLIMVFAQPKELRPPSAASPLALTEFVYELEDEAEGARISGDDPYSDQSWEVGEKLFRNWWWAFDSEVIRRSNEMRRLRGARMLGEGAVLGEVQ